MSAVLAEAKEALMPIEQAIDGSLLDISRIEIGDEHQFVDPAV